MQTPGTNKMEMVPVNKLLFSLSLPVMFSMIIQALYNIVDSIFIARFSEKALSAVSLTFPIQTLMIAISTGTCVGINAFLSRTLGERNLTKARTIAQHGVLLALFSYSVFLFIGLFFTRQFFEIQTGDTEIIAYGIDYMSVCLVFSISLFGQQLFEKLLQSNGRALLSMVSQLIGAIVNIILDPILIFGLFGFPVLGARGAAIATVIGQFTAFASAFLLHQHYNKELKLSFSKFHFDIAVMKEIYKIGLPDIVMQSIGSVTNFLLNGILLTFSAAATAVFGVYCKLQNFIFMPVYGLSSGILLIMSYNLGARKKERIMDTLRYGILYMAIIMAAGTAAFQFFPNQLLSLFSASDEMRSIGIPALRIISLYFIFEGFCLISQTSFQSLGRGTSSLICSLTRQIIVLLPAAYVLSLRGNINQIWLAYPIMGAASLAVCLLLWRDVYKKNIAPLNSK
jgi:putative MATE family efflux protein